MAPEFQNGCTHIYSVSQNNSPRKHSIVVVQKIQPNKRLFMDTTKGQEEGKQPSTASDGESISSSNDLSSSHPDESSKPSAASSPQPPKRKFRIIDETQLTEEEAKKLALRRAYNRDCATRARTRNKTLVHQLQQEVRQLKEEKEQMRLNFNEVQARLTLAELKNHELQAQQELLQSQQLPSARLEDGLHTTSSFLAPNHHQLLLLEAVQQQRRMQQQQELLQQSLVARSQASSLNASLFGNPSLPASLADTNLAAPLSSTNQLLMLQERLKQQEDASPSDSDLLYALLQQQQQQQQQQKKSR